MTTISQLKSASLSGFSFDDDLWFFSSADLLSAPAQKSLKFRFTPLQALTVDTSTRTDLYMYKGKL